MDWIRADQLGPTRFGKTYLALLHERDMRKQDGQHGPYRVVQDRGRGWITIPGMHRCQPRLVALLGPPPGGGDG